MGMHNDCRKFDKVQIAMTRQLGQNNFLLAPVEGFCSGQDLLKVGKVRKTVFVTKRMMPSVVDNVSCTCSRMIAIPKHQGEA